MEGRHALRPINLRSRIPVLCLVSFSAGAAIELMMCKSGFYNVYNVKQGAKIGAREREDAEFWLRVKSRRDAKSSLGCIVDD